MKKILIIEDQPVIRRNIGVMLEMEGFATISAADGETGLELARTEKPDLILCDVLMPRLDGHEVLRAVRADAATSVVPFVFLTAKSEKADLRAGMEMGADDFLTKPVNRKDLLAAVDARLERRRSHEQHTLQAALAAAAAPPDFSSHEPLRALGLTEREAEVLLWVAQGKTNGEIGLILGAAEKTVKKHMGHIFQKLGLENRAGAAARAVEALRAGCQMGDQRRIP